MNKAYTHFFSILFFLIVGFNTHAEIRNAPNLKLYNATFNSLRPFPNGLPVCQQTAFRALEKLYDATNGNNWIDHTNWFTVNNLAQWAGIALMPDGCDVQIISLGYHNLVGSLLNLNLPQLSFLYLAGNSLSGSIPSFNSTSFTTLDLGSNQLQGSIPNFTAPLQSLYLDNNGNLAGSIPNFSSTSLSTLWLNRNKFNFSDIVNKNWLSISNLIYAPQAKINLSYDKGVLSVSTGEPDNVQSFDWYLNEKFLQTTAASRFTPLKYGERKNY